MSGSTQREVKARVNKITTDPETDDTLVWVNVDHRPFSIAWTGAGAVPEVGRTLKLVVGGSGKTLKIKRFSVMPIKRNCFSRFLHSLSRKQKQQQLAYESGGDDED